MKLGYDGTSSNQGAPMDSPSVDPVVKYGWILVVILVILLQKIILRAFFATVIVAKDEIGIVNKKWCWWARIELCPTAPLSP
jgi:hypothetical protein